MTAAEKLLEAIRAVVREELAVATGNAPPPDDAEDVDQLAKEHAARLRRARGSR